MRLRPALTGLLVTALSAALALVAVPALAERVPRPVLSGDFADPAVTVSGNGFVGFSTGSLVPRSFSERPSGAWRPAGSSLVRLPSWSHADGDIWASDIARVGRWWVLYFAAPVRGIGEYGRCIGVARSRSATGGFTAIGGRPLVCPSYVAAPAAEDTVPVVLPGLPRAGVIDPSLVVAGGRPHLLYKTDRIPSSIRLLPLSRSGLHAAGQSVELFRHDGVLENPVLIERPTGWVMLLSQGDFTHCSYRTVWRRSTSILSWAEATTGVLLDQSSGLCGPGGADVTPMPHSKRLRVYFHAWTCRGSTTPCGPGIRKDTVRHRSRAIRPMYAADLDWVDGVPVVRGFL
ncbi:family 43 glycosylhydrolase [Nocardioides currus]|uniref:family 43 glycosylhydrolase n=1 Tax=Nocardioides currus TaxID=2133958 RepID=UPI0014040DF9|nr:family 43 glycosylhydrolase [Nocardioides currus]